MLMERLFDHLAVSVEPFATCEVASGWRLRLPPLDFVNLHFVLRGSGTLKGPGGKAHALARGTLAVVPPEYPHALECGRDVVREARPGDEPPPNPLLQIVAGPPEEADLVIACGRVKVTYGEDLGLFDRLRECIVLDFSESEQMGVVFEGLLGERHSRQEASGAMMTALMNQCLVLVFRRLSAHRDGRLPWLGALEDPRLAAVLDAILDRPEQPYTLESLASMANMSRSAFAKHFHESFGRTPIRYVREVRLRKAARLLRREALLSVEAVAHRVGFESRSQFSRAFADLFGHPPSEFRTQSAT